MSIDLHNLWFTAGHSVLDIVAKCWKATTSTILGFVKKFKNKFLIVLTPTLFLFYSLWFMKSYQNKPKFPSFSTWYDMLSRNKKFDKFNSYHITTSEKEAEDFKREMGKKFNVISSPPIRLCIAGSKVIESPKNSENYKIKDDKPPLFTGWENAGNALIFPGFHYKMLVNYVKNRFLSPKKPGVFFTFFEDNKKFWERSNIEKLSLLVRSNLDSRQNNWETYLNNFANKISDWEYSNNSPQPDLRNPIGLPNVGDTCYMNSLIQAFSVTPEIDQALNYIDSPIFKSLANIIRALKNGNKNFNYKQNLRKFQKEIMDNAYTFEAYYNHDPKELFSDFVDEPVPEYEIFQEKFTVIINNKCYCRGGNHDPVFKYESKPFLIIPNNSLENIDSYIRKDHYFRGENKLWCQNCYEMRDMKLKVEGVEYPLNLVIYLPENRITGRLMHHIELKNNDYYLYAVICRKRSTKIRHYWAHLLIKGKWIECNDRRVKNNSPNLANCYMLFYSKINP